jgi:hypothetical protein
MIQSLGMKRAVAFAAVLDAIIALMKVRTPRDAL